MPALNFALALLAASPVTWATANSVATGNQDHPAIAVNRNGRTAVAWEDNRDGKTIEIYLRTYQDGTSVFEKKLSAGGVNHTPDVGVDDRGNTVVVWAEDADRNGYYNVQYRVVSPTGSVLNSGVANANAAGDQLVPKVAVDPDGRPTSPSAVAFTVVYEDVQGSVHTVRAAGYTSGSTRAYDVSAGPATSTRPDVAVSASGDATVVFEQNADISLTRLSATNGAVLLSRRLANATTSGTQRRPAIAADFDGDFAVAWDTDGTVFVRSFLPSGSPRHTDVRASTSTGAATATIGIDDRAAVVVGWTRSGVDGWIHGFNPAGTDTGRLPEQTLTQTTTGRQDQYAVAVSPWSELSTAYTDDSDGNGSAQILWGSGVGNDTTAGDDFLDMNLA